MTEPTETEIAVAPDDAPESPKGDASPLEAAAQTGGYFDMALDLRAAGLEKEKAAFAAWWAVPPARRVPKTLGEFAKIVGISERTLRKWKFTDWWLEYQVDKVGFATLLEPLAQIDQATAQAALDGNARDRQLYYEELERRIRRREPPRQVEGLRGIDDFEHLSDDELWAEEQKLGRILSAQRLAPGAGTPAAGAAEAAGADQ